MPTADNLTSINKSILLGTSTTLDLAFVPFGTIEFSRVDGSALAHSSRVEFKVPQFWMGKYPITIQQWNFARTLPEIDNPLENVWSLSPRDKTRSPVPLNWHATLLTWTSAIEFCSRLSVYTGLVVRIPTEIEWEYAYRGGDSNHSPVGRESPNAFGLCDMPGLASEWCAGVNAEGDTNYASLYQVIRGAGHKHSEDAYSSVARVVERIWFRGVHTGFRVVVEISA